jgi:hypothetical protein
LFCRIVRILGTFPRGIPIPISIKGVSSLFNTILSSIIAGINPTCGLHKTPENLRDVISSLILRQISHPRKLGSSKSSPEMLCSAKVYTTISMFLSPLKILLSKFLVNPDTPDLNTYKQQKMCKYYYYIITTIV